MPGTQRQGPEFPPGGPLHALADLAENVARFLRSLMGVLESLVRLESSLQRAIGAGLLGLLGGVGVTVAGLSQVVAAPLWLYVLLGLAFQVLWLRRALSAVRVDSKRRRAIYDGHRDELDLEERFKKTRDWRHRWASSLVGPLRTPLERSDLVRRDMESAVGEVKEMTGHSLALVLVRKRRGARYEIVLTIGEVSDPLKAGTKWMHRDLDVHEYVAERSLYPHHLIEREVLGDAEYFLVVASEVDVIGKVKEVVLSCFLDVVGHGIGRVVAHGGS